MLSGGVVMGTFSNALLEGTMTARGDVIKRTDVHHGGTSSSLWIQGYIK